MITKYQKLSTYGKDVYYEILDDGFKIYVGQYVRPSIHQYEPYIPDPSKSYEENAIMMCEDLCKDLDDEANASAGKSSIIERLTDVEANIDYLMLLTDVDSATEETE